MAASVPNRLLVIDDEPDICDFIKEVAEENGFDVATANDFQQFTTAHRSFRPSVIVLDLRIPEVDGIELLRFLEKEECQAHILLMSGIDQKVLHTASQLGVSHGLNETPEIAILFTDVVLPGGMSGVDLVDEARHRRPIPLSMPLCPSSRISERAPLAVAAARRPSPMPPRRNCCFTSGYPRRLGPE